MNYIDKYNIWIKSDIVDSETKRELEAIASNHPEMEDRFYKDLEFGTGGLRGIIGAGSNRMNRYTVGKATQGLANYIKKQGGNASERGVAIAFDSRLMSKEFALDTAIVLNANGIRTYMYDELQPTPLLSFSVRHLNAIAGIVITASHNPPEYNGYKVYWEDGGQVVGKRADEIIDEVNNVDSFAQIMSIALDDAKNSGLFNIIDQSVIDGYLAKAKSLCINPDIVREKGEALKIVYTPLHGAGNKLVRRVLADLGFKNVSVVPEQELPDHRFPTVSYPNPEDRHAFKLAIELAKTENADIIIATDPDCDRVGVAVKDLNGEYILLNGNQTGALLVNYILSALSANNMLPENGALIKTIVTSELSKEIANSYKVKTIDTYTGFKFIAREILKMEKEGHGKFIFGFEESFGYMPGDFVRDKDAVTASMLICEALAWYKSRNMGLYEGLLEIWGKYGFYKDYLLTITMKGLEGIGKIRLIMDGLRENQPKRFAGFDIAAIDDYKTLISFDPLKGLQKSIDMEENSDVLRYTLTNGWWFAIRPSGTEPKAKVYFSVVGESIEDADEKMQLFVSSVTELIDLLGG